MRLDVERLCLAVDAQRREWELSWRAVAVEAGVSPSLFTRMVRHGRRPDVDSLVRVMAWLGTTDLRMFVKESTANDVTPFGGEYARFR